jgi:hypothetical protein
MSTEYLESAPPHLISIHRGRKRFPGRKILECLLTDTSMKRSWIFLGKHIKTNQEWERFWKEIAYILRCARKKPTKRSEKEKVFLNVAKKTRSLEELIEGGVLDIRVYELFPDEVMGILGIPNWKTLGSLERADCANKLLIEWPTVPEFLYELSARAEKIAGEAMTETRVIEQVSLTYEARYFARSLVAYLNRTYQVKLCGSVAKVTNAVLNSNIDSSFVEKL